MNTASLTLRPVKRATKASNRFCGPSIISALTGLDTADTARLLRQITGRRSIKGTSTHAVKTALSRLGIETAHFPRTYDTGRHLTFVQWERRSRAERSKDAILLVMGNHWAAVQGRRYVCGLTRQPVPFSRVPHRCARVTEAYRLTRLDTGKRFASLVPPPPPRRVDAFAEQRAAAKSLAARYGIRIEDGDNRGEWWVWAPESAYEANGVWPDGEGDPLDGQRFCTDWGEVLDAVTVYADALKQGVTRLREAASPAPVSSADMEAAANEPIKRDLLAPSTPYRFEVENGCGDTCRVLLNVKPGRKPQTYIGCAIVKVMRQGPIPNEGPWRVLAYWPEGNEAAKVEVVKD